MPIVTGALLGLNTGTAVDFSNPYRLAAILAAYLFFNYLFLWLLRRFGLLAVMAMWLINNLFVTILGTSLTSSLTSWYAGRMLVGNGIGVAIAAWALWVILSAKRGTESAPAWNPRPSVRMILTDRYLEAGEPEKALPEAWRRTRLVNFRGSRACVRRIGRRRVVLPRGEPSAESLRLVGTGALFGPGRAEARLHR